MVNAGRANAGIADAGVANASMANAGMANASDEPPGWASMMAHVNWGKSLPLPLGLFVTLLWEDYKLDFTIP